MNRFKFAILLIFFSFFMFAEYQVFNYRASFKMIEPAYKIINGTICRVNKVVSDSQSGYLVTVCCYPCGAYFGSAYPTWLFVVSKRCKNTAFKIQVSCEGGLFGDRVSMYHVGKMEDYRLTKTDKDLLKKTTKSWFRMHLDEKKSTVLYVKVPNGAGYLIDKSGNAPIAHMAFGAEGEYAEIDFFGYGTADWKINQKLVNSLCDFNMYIKSASGTLGGMLYTDGEYTYDPSNYILQNRIPITGTFTITFNNTMTELIRGTADWEEITKRILSKMKYEDLIQEDYESDKEYYFVE